jgi:hypothetical protein
MIISCDSIYRGKERMITRPYYTIGRWDAIIDRFREELGVLRGQGIAPTLRTMHYRLEDKDNLIAIDKRFATTYSIADCSS